MSPLIFQNFEQALRRRVVQTLSHAAHRAGHAVLFHPRLKGVYRSLAPFIGMMNHSRRRLLSEPRNGQRTDDDVSRHPCLDRSADEFPVEIIEDHGQIQPNLADPDVGHAGTPRLIRYLLQLHFHFQFFGVLPPSHGRRNRFQRKLTKRFSPSALA